MKQRVRLEPFVGMDGRRYADEIQQGTSMRGGYNVEVIDGEWWARSGREAVRRKVGSIPWFWYIEHDTGNYICNPFYVLKIRLSDAKFNHAYARDTSETVTVTNGQSTATSTSTRTEQQLMMKSATGFTDEVYRVCSVSGTTITLDRPYEGTSGAATFRFVNPIVAVTGGQVFGGLAVPDPVIRPRGGVAIFDQTVTHAASSLGYANPAVTTGHSYLVITLGETIGSSLEENYPVAIDASDHSAAPLTNFVYRTDLSTPTKITNPAGYGGPVAVEVLGGRLILGALNDPNGGRTMRTFWYSRDGDMLLWHTGIQGGTVGRNYVTLEGGGNNIIDLRNLGANLVVHREHGQSIVGLTGSDSAPFQIADLFQNRGCILQASIVEADNAHWYLSKDGLVRFDGHNTQLISRDIHLPMKAQGALSHIYLRSGAADYANNRIYWFFSYVNRHQSAAIPSMTTTSVLPTTDPESGEAYTNVCGALVYDYDTNNWWVEDHVTLIGGLFSTSTNRMYGCRIDGSIVDMEPFDTTTGLDSALDPADSDYCTDAYAETPWLDFGTLERKMITKLIIDLRALDLTTGGYPSITDLWALTTETLHFCTVEICKDGSNTAASSTDLNQVVSTMLALTATENQQMPLMHFEIRNPRVSGSSFKFKFKNALSSAATSAGHTKAQFRLVSCEVYYEQMASVRSESFRDGTASS